MNRIACCFVGLAVAGWFGPAWAQQPGARDLTVARLPQKWALLIGVNDYSEVTDLQYCGADIEALRSKLVDAGFPESHVFVMTDRAEAKYRPSKGNVERQLELVTQLTEPDDLLVLAFSGHGVHIGGESYLCPSDASLDRPADTLVSIDRVYAMLEQCSARQKVLLVDACRNDPVPAGNKSLDGIKSMDEFADSLEAPEGVLLFSSCKKGQISVEDPDFQHGAFMYFVLKGLEGDADREMGNRDGAISLLELYRYAADRTKTHVVRTRNVAQTPTLKGEFSLDYDLAYVPERITAPADSATPSPQPAAADSAMSQPPEPRAAGETGTPGAAGTSEAVDAATRAQIDGLLKSADTHQASGNYDQAIEAYSGAIRLDPSDKTLYLKRGELYRLQGKFVWAVADFQAAGSLLQLTVTADSAPLQTGQNETGTVVKGQVVNVREWKKLGEYDWLYVVNVGGDATLHGWIMLSAVEKPKPAPAPAPASTATAAASPSPSYSSGSNNTRSMSRSPSSGYSGGSGGGYYDPSGLKPLERATVDRNIREAESAWNRYQRSGNPAALGQAGAAAGRAIRAYNRAQGGGGGGGGGWGGGGGGRGGFKW